MQGQSSRSSNSVDSQWTFPMHKWVSALPLPDAPCRLHKVELSQIMEGLSSLSQALAASQQTRLEGLAIHPSPGFTTFCVHKHRYKGGVQTLPNYRQISK